MSLFIYALIIGQTPLRTKVSVDWSFRHQASFKSKGEMDGYRSQYHNIMCIYKKNQQLNIGLHIYITYSGKNCMHQYVYKMTAMQKRIHKYF